MPRLRLGSLMLLAASVSCGSTEPRPGGSGGGLQLVTVTAGIQPDSDGYTIMVDGAAHGTIGSNDSVTVPDLAAGSHTVELSGIGFNCATLGEFTRSVSVAADAGASVDYTVSCDALSRSRIAFVDGYTDPKVLIMNADGSDISSLSDSLGAVYTDVNSFRPPVGRRQPAGVHPGGWSAVRNDRRRDGRHPAGPRRRLTDLVERRGPGRVPGRRVSGSSARLLLCQRLCRPERRLGGHSGHGSARSDAL